MIPRAHPHVPAQTFWGCAACGLGVIQMMEIGEEAEHCFQPIPPDAVPGLPYPGAICFVEKRQRERETAEWDAFMIGKLFG